MAQQKKSRTPALSAILPKLVEAGLDGNRQRLELLSLNAIRSFKIEFPEMTEELGNLLARFSGSGQGLRWQTEPPPSDADAGLALVRLPSTDDAPQPILQPSIQNLVERFVRERVDAPMLLKEGFSPPRTLLLKGGPGTGKTMLARWLAHTVKLPLVVLDLASSISSYLGKTGGNLRRSLDYARATPCILLLDEFDAIGKRRDDVGEIGELKRIVNVLLKELEDWPMHSVLVAATNHPELLDPAINRRFDVVIEIPPPGTQEREAIFLRSVGRFAEALPLGFITTVSELLAGRSGSDVDTAAQAMVRRHVIEKLPLTCCFIEELEQRFPETFHKKGIGQLLRKIQDATGLSVREIAAMVGKSASTVQYHLTKEKEDA